MRPDKDCYLVNFSNYRAVNSALHTFAIFHAHRIPAKWEDIVPKPFRTADTLNQTTAMLITRGFSLTNFIIGSSALCFQVFILYPWHNKLEKDFEEMRDAHISLMKQSEKDRTEELKAIHERLQNIKQPRGWLW
ncbi:conserved hypothetical protein [Histoplasma capsulatum var. duboisii H88]|uniref:Mitochondrial phosphate carrier protein n=2 Tax=Ajellomyces capsulatus (strain H88) TaxID=544711 RepID=F0UBG2_AJEC8|nr:conserved hypothetical protein [Histoplasma capsulatum var. duboisii H88]